MLPTRKPLRFPFLLSAFTLVSALALAQAPVKVSTDKGPIDFEEYEPVSTLKVAEHKVTRAKYPFIDVHNHQFQMDNMDLRKLLTQMDSLNMGLMVNLSGRGFTNTPPKARASSTRPWPTSRKPTRSGWRCLPTLSLTKSAHPAGPKPP